MATHVFHACFALFLMMSAAADDRSHGRSTRSIMATDFFLRISNMFGGGDVGRPATGDRGDAKPDFITTLDIIRLFDGQYAMKQFYCVVNEDSCDSVGLRLKASIPEEINRSCRRCTSTETMNIRRMVSYVKQNYPEFWHRVEPIYKDKL